MLLNLSNHPTTKWTPEQLNNAIQQFTQVQDMPFPNIPPTATTDKVKQIADEYYNKILKIAAKHHTLTVHLMGEMTFTYHLVTKLQTFGIACVASTTERTVLEEINGKKTFLFKFVQFRAYPKY